MYLPQGTVVDSSGNLYIADSSNHRVRMVAGNSSIVSTYAGGGSGIDGSLASQASLGFVSSITMDSSDNLFIADVGNHRVRFVVRSPGIITSYAGNGGYGYTGDDGPATLAQVGYPRGLALDSYGNLYISDDQIHRVRVVKKDTGIITTYAGNGVVDEFGTSGYSGDGGAATLAQLNGPQGLAVDIYNNLYIADTSNHVIRVVSANTGIITTIAGNGFQGYSGDGGLPRSAKLYGPTGVTVDPSSFNIFIADTFNNRIRMISNLTGIITTVAGNGNSGSSGDGGDAKSAQIYWPYGVSLDLNGNLIVADTYNNAVRLVTPKPVPSASPTAAPTIGIVVSSKSSACTYLHTHTRTYLHVVCI